jgi:nitroreductase
MDTPHRPTHHPADAAEASPAAPAPGLANTTAAVDAVMRGRRSIRAFLPDEVPQALVDEMLAAAARAPSGTNTQPWRVHVLHGAARQALTDKILAVFDDPVERAQHQEEYAYYPTEWRSPYIERRRKVGWDLYSLLGIGKADKERMHAQHARNYAFFGAPVGLMFTIERVMQQGSWLDYGMFLQNVMLAARARGLDTCPQAAFTQFHRVISEHLQLPPGEMVVCGMSLGYADPTAVENTLVTERDPVSTFTKVWR